MGIIGPESWVGVAEAATVIAPVEANSILKIEIEDVLNVHEFN